MTDPQALLYPKAIIFASFLWDEMTLSYESPLLQINAAP